MSITERFTASIGLASRLRPFEVGVKLDTREDLWRVL
jgi:hypothetical protein